MIVSDLKRILEILENNELGMEYIGTDHDIIYIPIKNRDDIDMAELLDLGVIYSEDYGSYIAYT